MRPRGVVTGGTLLLAIVALQAGCSQAPARPEGQGAVPVLLADVQMKDVPVRIAAIGTVESYSTVAIKAQVGGLLREVHFREGQDVRRGDLLFRIDPRPFQAALEQAQAALARDTVQLKTARQEVARYVDLVKKEYVTQEEYDRIETNAAALEASVRADQAAVDDATINLEYCTIQSPIDGRTGQLMVHAGNVVKANADTPMVVINQVNPIFVSFSVPEQELPAVKARRAEGKLPVRVSGAGDPLTGSLTFVDNTVDRTTGTVLLKATFANAQRVLWPGQFVNVSLEVDTMHDALVVPSQAIQTGQQGAFVFVVKPDLTVESRPVEVAETLDHESVVRKGLQQGEKVVTDGQIRLVPGSRVEARSGVDGGAEGSQ